MKTVFVFFFSIFFPFAFMFGNSDEVTADFSFTNACIFAPVLFTDLSQGDVTIWEWNFDGVGNSDLQDPEFTFSGDGVFLVRLIVSNSCDADTIEKQITINSQIPIFQDTTVCNNEPVIFNGVTYQKIVPSSTVFTFIDTLITAQGCDSLILLRVTVNPCGCELTFPNAFTPDGDGVNDRFQPYVVCDETIRNYRMIIYDRWGEIVFETFQHQDFWDGNINGFPMPTDVLVYIVEYEIINSRGNFTVKEISDFTLIR